VLTTPLMGVHVKDFAHQKIATEWPAHGIEIQNLAGFRKTQNIADFSIS
jgi:hypothetical protein